MHQFFVEASRIQGKHITIEGRDVNHIKNVLRLKPGEEIAVSNGKDDKEYRCIIRSLENDRIVCELAFVKEAGVELPARIFLFQGLPKADKMEMIIQKAVELGVYEVIPVATARSVVRLEGKKALQRVERWQTIAEAAAKQSKRNIIPGIHGIMNWKEAVERAATLPVKLIPYELAEGMETTRRIIEGLKPGDDMAVFIGPEGGFEEWEVELAMEKGILPITLGRRILRTETAGMTLLAWIMYHLEGKA